MGGYLGNSGLVGIRRPPPPSPPPLSPRCWKKFFSIFYFAFRSGWTGMWGQSLTAPFPTL